MTDRLTFSCCGRAASACKFGRRWWPAAEHNVRAQIHVKAGLMKTTRIKVHPRGKSDLIDGVITIWVKSRLVTVGSVGAENSKDYLDPGDRMVHKTANGGSYEVRLIGSSGGEVEFDVTRLS